MSSPDPAFIRQRLHDHALELGFSLFGISPADSEADLRDRLFQWLTRGYQASMGWMARNAERRADPQKVLPGARSIISVAINYYHPDRHDEECGALKVSRYAWGDDYHTLASERLETLRQTLEELLPGARSLTYVDTGPLLEKAIAQRAGLGWVGRNTCLITRDFGSWVFLGEIITTAELPPDLPHTDFCGSCTRCLEACPTDAFPAPYVLDANRCISYWTIEHRGEIPEDMSSQFDGWIFGCDICQDVCPWNKFARPSPEPAFAPRPECLSPAAGLWSNLTADAFKTAFAGSPILRARAEGLARNIRSQCADPLPVAIQQARTLAALTREV